MAGTDNLAVGSLSEATIKAREVARRLTEGGQDSDQPRKRPANSDFDSSMAKKTDYNSVLDRDSTTAAAFDHQSITVDIKIPDSLVGKVIGKGGENILKMQEAAGGVKIQVAPNGSAVDGERTVTLTGAPPEKVHHAKYLIMEVVSQNKEETHSGPTGQLDANSEVMMIPAPRVGLIIGKGGTTIKSLSEQSGCTLKVIQDGQWQNTPEKPLRITGERDNRMRAKQLVSDMIAARESGQMGGGSSRGYGGGGGGGPVRNGAATHEYTVPASQCGVIIGKGGDTIRQLMSQTGAHIEVSRAPPPTEDQRVFIIEGSPSQIEAAKSAIIAKLDSQDQYPQRGANSVPSMGYHMQAQQQPNLAYGGGLMDGGQQMYWDGQQQQQQPQQPGQQGTAVSQTGQPSTQDYRAEWVEYYRQMGYAFPGSQQQVQGQPQQAFGQAGQLSSQQTAQWAQYYQQLGYNQQQQGQPQAQPQGQPQAQPQGLPPVLPQGLPPVQLQGLPPVQPQGLPQVK